MLNNASGFRKVYIAAGYTDLRRGIDGLASIVKFNFQLDPYEKDILFLFCGRRSDRIKGWSGKGTDSFSSTKGWSLAVSAGPVQKKRRWKSHRNNIRHGCRVWRSSPDIRSRKCIPKISCNALCKTEKIKNLFAFTD